MAEPLVPGIEVDAEILRRAYLRMVEDGLTETQQAWRFRDYAVRVSAASDQLASRHSRWVTIRQLFRPTEHQRWIDITTKHVQDTPPKENP